MWIAFCGALRRGHDCPATDKAHCPEEAHAGGASDDVENPLLIVVLVEPAQDAPQHHENG